LPAALPFTQSNNRGHSSWMEIPKGWGEEGVRGRQESYVSGNTKNKQAVEAASKSTEVQAATSTFLCSVARISRDKRVKLIKKGS